MVWAIPFGVHCYSAWDRTKVMGLNLLESTYAFKKTEQLLKAALHNS